MKYFEVTGGKFIVGTNKGKLDINFIIGNLSNESQWAKNIPHDTEENELKDLCIFGLWYCDYQKTSDRI